MLADTTASVLVGRGGCNTIRINPSVADVTELLIDRRLSMVAGSHSSSTQYNISPKRNSNKHSATCGVGGGGGALELRGLVVEAADDTLWELIVSTRRFGGVVADVKPWDKALDAIVQDSFFILLLGETHI